MVWSFVTLFIHTSTHFDSLLVIRTDNFAHSKHRENMINVQKNDPQSMNEVSPFS